MTVFQTSQGCLPQFFWVVVIVVQSRHWFCAAACDCFIHLSAGTSCRLKGFSSNMLSQQRQHCSHPMCLLQVLYRERAAGMYTAMPFALAQCCVEIPWNLRQATLFSCVSYWMINFAHSPGTASHLTVWACGGSCRALILLRSSQKVSSNARHTHVKSGPGCDV